jgi:hypothetical protein
LHDWLGDDLYHANQELANYRSLVCIHGSDGLGCPHNKSPRWWETAKVAVAEVIRGQLEIKQKLQMKTEFDDQLGICDVCGCCLPLAVWSPIERIREHTTLKQKSEFPESFCWKKKEL